MKKYLMIALFGFALTAMTSCTVDGFDSTTDTSLNDLGDDTGGQHSTPPPPPPPPPGTNP